MTGAEGEPRDRVGSWRRASPRHRGWAVAAGVVLVPAALLLGAADLETRFGSPAAALKSLANLSALTGTAVFAATVVLAARIGAAERLMGGFDRMYRIHRVLGYTVPIVLVAHAVLVASSKATSSVRSGLVLFVPAAGWSVFVGVIALVGVVAILLVPLLRSLRHETFVRVHRLIGVMFLLGIAHVLLVPSTWALPPLLVAYLLGLLLAGAVAFAYRSVFGRYAVRRRVAHTHMRASCTTRPRLLVLLLPPVVPPSAAGSVVLPVLQTVAEPFAVAHPVCRRLPSARRGRVARRLAADGAQHGTPPLHRPASSTYDGRSGTQASSRLTTSRGAPSASHQPPGHTSGQAPIAAAAKYRSRPEEVGHQPGTQGYSTPAT